MKIGQSSRDMNSTSLMAYCKASNYLSLNEQAIFERKVNLSAILVPLGF